MLQNGLERMHKLILFLSINLFPFKISHSHKRMTARWLNGKGLTRGEKV